MAPAAGYSPSVRFPAAREVPRTVSDQDLDHAWPEPGERGGVDALVPGMSLGSRYRLVDRLGHGGMASVWRAVDQVLGRLVAVKVLASGLMADRGFLERFRVEARSAAQLSHPHITSVFDYGEWDPPGGQRLAFIVMELLEGESLAARLQRGPLPWPEAVGACTQVAQALAAAHRRGVVHRDIKPGNVVLSEAGAKVLDFGIAAMAGEEALTSSGGVLGTASYVAPELLAGGLVTPAADVYALGMVLYESLTGAPPAGDGTAEAAASLAVIPGLPWEIALLDQRCLARLPAERPSSAEVAKRLGATLGVGSWHNAPLRPASAGPDTALLPPQAAGQRATRARARTPRRRRWWLLAGTLAVAALVVAAVALALRPPEGGQPASSTTAAAASTSTPSSTSTESTTSEPSASAPLAALEQLRRSVDEGVAAGDIRADVGEDLGHAIDDLQERLADGRLGGLGRRVEQLRRKVNDRVEEHAISPARAEELSQALDALADALRSD
jgi:eukaryotic-like serine/threonine-protein kinase